MLPIIPMHVVGMTRAPSATAIESRWCCRDTTPALGSIHIHTSGTSGADDDVHVRSAELKFMIFATAASTGSPLSPSRSTAQLLREASHPAISVRAGDPGCPAGVPTRVAVGLRRTRRPGRGRRRRRRARAPPARTDAAAMLASSGIPHIRVLLEWLLTDGVRTPFIRDGQTQIGATRACTESNGAQSLGGSRSRRPPSPSDGVGGRGRRLSPQRGPAAHH